MRLGGSAVIRECVFLSNRAYTRGLAVAVVGSANISGSTFDGNDLSCAAGSYRSETVQVNTRQGDSWRNMCGNAPQHGTQ